jgi:transcription-repair coupling factor (superfamily II helicase)
LLGAEQSGTVASVGFDMFCQMLDEATRELRGEEVSFEIDPELTFDVEALLPDTYIEEVGIRLSLYKRLASAPDEEEVRQLTREMEDRFGPPPPEALRLVEMMQLKVDLRRLRVLVCEGARGSVSLRFRDDTPVDPLKLTKFVASQKSCYRLTPEGKLIRKSVEGEGLSSSLDLAERVISDVLQLLD